MDREIKFRGKTESNQFIFGDLIQYENGDTAIFEKKITRYGYEATQISNRTKVDKETIGQFTGLHDKNGKEIYEGDIVRFHFMSSRAYSSELFPTKKFFGEITTNKYNLWAILSDGLEIHIENAIKYGEVIGNKFDNPELLEE